MLCVGIYAFVFCTYRSVVTHVKQFVIKQRSSGRTPPEMSGISISLTITGIKETRGNYATGKKEKEKRHSQVGESRKQYGKTDE